MIALSARAARRLRKANRKSHPPLSITERERLRNRVLRVTPSDSWTDHACTEGERAGLRATTQRLYAKLAEFGIFPPIGDRIHMRRCDRCGHVYPPQYLVSVFHFCICQDCNAYPSVSDHETSMVKDARYSVLMQILKQARLKEMEIAALCHQWEGVSQRGIAVLMNRSKTWVRELLVSANAKLRDAGIQLPDPPKAPVKRPEVAFISAKSLEHSAGRRAG